MNDDPMAGDAPLSLTLTGSFDADFCGRLGAALTQIARAQGKDVDAVVLTPTHLLIVVSDLDSGDPRPDSIEPDAGPAVELQHGVDRSVECASC